MMFETDGVKHFALLRRFDEIQRNDEYQDFFWELYPPGPYHDYFGEYFLDLKKIQEMSEFTFSISKEMENEITKLPIESRKKVFESLAKENQKNYAAKEAEKFLEDLEENAETTLKKIEDVLILNVVRKEDFKYDDFRFPRWKIINGDSLKRSISHLSFESKNKLIMVTGWLVYIQDPVQEKIIKARYFCTKCQNNDIYYDIPHTCNVCGQPSKFVRMDEDMETKRFQEGILIENYEDASGFPLSVKVVFEESLTGKYSPGDRIKIVGILKGEKNPKEKDPKILIHSIHAYSVEKSENSNISLTEEEIKKFKEIAEGKNALEYLKDRFASYLFGMDPIKKALILQAASSPAQGTTSVRKRGEIHILLVGDPGLGKSQILRAAGSLNPKFLYVSDASAAGLTASVTELSGKKIMSAGVLVLADGGVAAVDELDKMKSEDREGIHTAIEQGIISKSKAGLHATFLSRTSIIAAANPKLGRFDIQKSISDQIDIEAPLLNRFDLIFILKDMVGDIEFEIEKAHEILNSEISEDKDLKKYVFFCRSINPVLTPEVEKKITEYYGSLRKKSTDVYINARVLESIKRLTLASARVNLRMKTEISDFSNAAELIDIYLKQFNWDVEAISGVTQSIRSKGYKILELLRDHSMTIEELCGLIGDKNKVSKAVNELAKEGEIYLANNGKYRVVS